MGFFTEFLQYKTKNPGYNYTGYSIKRYYDINQHSEDPIEIYWLVYFPSVQDFKPDYECRAIVHGKSGYIDYSGALELKQKSGGSTSDFDYPLLDNDFPQLKNHAQSVSHNRFYFTNNNYGYQLFRYGISSTPPHEDFILGQDIVDSDMHLRQFLFNDYNKYLTACDNIINNANITSEMLDGGREIKEDLYGAWINTLDAINYVSEKRNGTAYLKSNTDKAELLICYYDKQNIKIVPNFKEIASCHYKIGASAIVNKPLWNGEDFETIGEYLDYFNFTTETIEINLTSNDFITVGEFNLPKVDTIVGDVGIGLPKTYVVDNVQDNVLFNDLNVRILRFNSNSDFNKWREGDETIKFEEIDTNISPKPKDDFNDIINLNDITLPTSNMNRLYRLTGSELLDLSMYLWNVDTTVYDELIKDLKLMGANPLDAIISIRLYPFLISRFCNLVQGTQINIGRASTGVSGSRINATTPKLHICDFTLTRNYNDFKDYEPYTSYKLYLPYAQTIDLNPQGIYNVNIGVDLIVDINTGMGEYVISYNNSPITFVNCKIGIEIPYSASQERINSSALLQSAMNVGVGALMGNEVGALLGGVKSAFEIRQNSNKFMNGGVGGSFINLINPQNVYLIKYHTPYNEPTNYNFQHGYPYEKFNNINSLGGKVWIENPIVDDVPCTELERNEIVNLLQNGVQLD